MYIYIYNYFLFTQIQNYGNTMYDDLTFVVFIFLLYCLIYTQI